MRRPGAASPQGKGVSPPAAGPQAGSRRPHLAVAPTGDEAINALLTTRTAHADAAAISLPDGKRGLEEIRRYSGPKPASIQMLSNASAHGTRRRRAISNCGCHGSGRTSASHSARTSTRPRPVVLAHTRSG